MTAFVGAARGFVAGATPRARLVNMASIVVLGVFPVLVVVMLFVTAVSTDNVAIDFRQFYVAGQAILDGKSPYAGEPTPWGGPYPYPPLPGVLAVPLSLLPSVAAGLIVMVALVVAILVTLYVLEIRDWRCYGLVLLWPPVISAIQTGNITLWLGLALAVAWRFRERVAGPSVAIGTTLAAKFFLWPVLVWMAATRRFTAAVAACLIGAALLLASWAVIGFAGLSEYPEVLERLEDTVGADSYTAYIVGLDLGLSSPAARIVWLFVGLGLLGAVVLTGRRDERTSFLLAVAAALALTPIVWLHYFALLAVVVAVARPRLGMLWFLPLGLILTPGSGQPTPFETAWTLGVAALTVAVAVRESRQAEVVVPTAATLPSAAAEAT